MNKTAIYSTIIASTIAVLAVFAVSSSEVEAVPPSKVACPAEQVQHWVTLSFVVSNTIEHATEPDITNGGIMRAPQSSDQIATDNGEQLVADTLNDLEYFVNDGGPRPVEPTDLGGGVIYFVNSLSTICATS